MTLPPHDGRAMSTPPAHDADRPATLAAVDLGSNSFHMIVVRASRGEFQVQDRLREMVQLGAGLDADNRLSEKARRRALECLERFGQRLRSLPRANVRVVGTNTLRKARDTGGFLRRAADALGHPVDIISGIEEARLIYLGVAHSLPECGGRRLAVDIGGGSTEVIIGQGFEPLALESLYMGCVSMSREHFSAGRIDAGSWRRARIAAALEVEGVVAHFRARGWDEAVGASGTVRAIARVLQAQGWGDGTITAAGLTQLEQALIAAGSVDRLGYKGMSRERAEVFPGGVVVLQSLFSGLGIERMTAAEGALREGLIYDQLGRIGHADARERSVEAVCRRYGVDLEQARRVQATAESFRAQAAAPWEIQDEYSRLLLRWGAALHEIGLAVAHAQFHRHGAYIVAHADLQGFSQQDQALLAVLVRGHRRKFPLTEIAALPDGLQQPAARLCSLLRLAVILHRARTPAPLPEIRLRARPRELTLEFPHRWLEGRPLTLAELGREARLLEPAGIALAFG